MELTTRRITSRNIQIEFSRDIPLESEGIHMYANGQPLKPETIRHRQAGQLKITLDLTPEPPAGLLYEPSI